MKADFHFNSGLCVLCVFHKHIILLFRTNHQNSRAIWCQLRNSHSAYRRLASSLLYNVFYPRNNRIMGFPWNIFNNFFPAKASKTWIVGTSTGRPKLRKTLSAAIQSKLRTNEIAYLRKLCTIHWISPSEFSTSFELMKFCNGIVPDMIARTFNVSLSSLTVLSVFNETGSMNSPRHGCHILNNQDKQISRSAYATRLEPMPLYVNHTVYLRMPYDFQRPRTLCTMTISYDATEPHLAGFHESRVNATFEAGVIIMLPR